MVSQSVRQPARGAVWWLSVCLCWSVYFCCPRVCRRVCRRGRRRGRVVYLTDPVSLHLTISFMWL